MTSRRSLNYRMSTCRPKAARARTWVAAVVLGLAIAAVAVGQERVPSPSGSPPRQAWRGAEPDGDDLDDKPLPKPNPRPSDFRYPPTYSTTKKEKEYPNLTALRKWMFGDGADDKKPAEKADKEKEPAKKEPSKKEPAKSESRGGESRGVPLHPFTPPAWKWYGYGAPVPGLNPLAPNGVYQPVIPDWYVLFHATPGAVPSLLPPQDPVLPGPLPHPGHGPMLPRPDQPGSPILPPPAPAFPGAFIAPGGEPAIRSATIVPPIADDPSMNNAPILPWPEPPAGARPADLQLPAAGPTREPPLHAPAEKPAKIQVPLPPGHSESGNAVPLRPLSARPARTPASVARAQSPEAEGPPAALLKSLQATCTGYVSRIDVFPKGPGKIKLRLALIAGIQPDRLADRISKAPALAGYEVEMEFAR